MKNLIKIIVLFFSISLYGQINISGIVSDFDSGEALPFATIRYDKNLGDLSDTDGKFYLDTNSNIKSIEVSYVGYYKTKVLIEPGESFYHVKLKRKSTRLNEVVVSDERINPAIKVIQNTINNKNINNPQKVLDSYSYNSYSKFIVTAHPDSIKATTDSVWTRKSDGSLEFRNIDSSNYKLRKTLDRQHLYLSEKISEVKFKKGSGEQEEVKASRMAGFREPIYEFLALNIQSFSFYDDYYTILGSKYLNPIAGNISLNIYDYKILDTIQNNTHNSIMVYFKPKKSEGKKAGLEGLLYIDDRKYSIEKAIVELKAIVRITGSIGYRYNEKNKIWFPEEIDLLLRKGDNRKSISLLGVPLEVEPDYDSVSGSDIVKQNAGYKASDYIYLNSKSKYFDIELNPEIDIKHASLGIIIDDQSHKKDEDFWNKYRSDTIGKRGRETYVVIDSIVEAEGIENRIKLLRSLSSGFYGTKYFDFDLNSFVDYNGHEGVRIGIGGKTSANISPVFNIEPYIAYGFRDQQLKGGAKLNFRLNKLSDTWLSVTAAHDVKPSSLAEFGADTKKLFIYDLYRMKNKFFYSYKSYKLMLQHNIQANLKSVIELEKNFTYPEYNYQYVKNNEELSEFDLSMLNIAVNWEPYSKFIQSRAGTQRIEEKFPQIGIQYQHSFENILGSELNFDKINLKFHHRAESYTLGTSDFFFKGGISFGDVPLPYLYTPNPNSYLKNPWLTRVNYSGTFTFETMLFKEFFAERYFEFHFRQTSTRFEISSNIKPQLAFVSRFAIGDFKNNDKHSGMEINSFEKGYYESGIELIKIIYGFGLGTYYRYGPYAQSKWENNLFLKVSFKWSLF